MTPQKSGNRWRCIEWKAGKSVAVYFDSYEEAQRYSADHENLSKLKIPTLSKLAEEYINTDLRNKRENTKKTTRSAIKQFAIISENISDFKRLENVIKVLEGKRKSYQQLLIKKLSEICRFVKAEHRYSVDIDIVRIRKTLGGDDRKIKKFLSDDEIAKLLTGYSDNVYIYRYMVLYGTRVAEVCNLSVSNISIGSHDDFTMIIPSNVAKSGSQRKFSISPSMGSCILMECRKRIKNPKPEDPLFPTEKGERRTPNGLAESFKRYSKKSIGSERNIHLLRAACWKNLYRATGGNMFVLKKIAGWDSCEMEKYIGGLDVEMLATAKRLDAIANSYISGTFAKDVKTPEIIIKLKDALIKYCNGNSFDIEGNDPLDPLTLCLSNDWTQDEFNEFYNSKDPILPIKKLEQLAWAIKLDFSLIECKNTDFE